MKKMQINKELTFTSYDCHK